MSATKSLSNTEDCLHLIFKFFHLGLTGEHIHQRELLIYLHDSIPLLICINRGFINTISMLINSESILRKVTSKSIDFKRNINLLTEPNQIVELFDCIGKNVRHRSRPIKNKNQSMILTIRNSSNFPEQVFAVLVSMQFRTIQNSCPRSRSASICAGRLTTLKFFYKIIYFFLCRLFKVRVSLIHIVEEFLRGITPGIRDILIHISILDNDGI